MEIHKYLTTIEAAELLKQKAQTLAKWRCLGKGPTYYRIGRSIRYSQEELIAWIKTYKYSYKQNT